jgi:hypothetical protein
MSDDKMANEELEPKAKEDEAKNSHLEVSNLENSGHESNNTVVTKIKNNAKTEKRRLQRQRRRQKEAQMRKAKETAFSQGDLFIPAPGAPRRKPQHRWPLWASVYIPSPRRRLHAEFDTPNPWE